MMFLLAFAFCLALALIAGFVFVHFAARVAATRPALIADWRAAHRLWSVRLAAIGTMLMGSLAAFPDLWAEAPPEVRAYVPHNAQALIPLLLFLATLASRVVKQAPATTSSTS